MPSLLKTLPCSPTYQPRVTVLLRSPALSVHAAILVTQLINRACCPSRWMEGQSFGRGNCHERPLLVARSAVSCFCACFVDFLCASVSLCRLLLRHLPCHYIFCHLPHPVLAAASLGSTTQRLLPRLPLPENTAWNIGRMRLTISLSTFATSLRLLPLPVVTSSPSKEHTMLAAPF